ncbi:glutamyl-tRNA(Gln) amidotransferase subunit A, mitochondrial [Fopius arisanus]|uniref:Glutamyl-tRNA(Gln) amidotransferase subunit A, mitochondrial n=1 Tax=Fopius arisanus TaxID=64838 RepID=A0A9R1T1D1_9HYME|nr:PREDICTED: glutamyl-tRNA(Gln) amidotransferase subunit A, mitochondrial [Fopius arisanus]
MNKILSSSIKEVSKKIRSKELKPSDLHRASCNLISSTKALNAYIHTTENIGTHQAVASDTRQNDNKLLGDLDGIPIAIKDNFCVEGEPTTCASLMLANFVPGYSATVYERLKSNGVVLMGKTNLDQFAMGAGTVDSYFGSTRNIWGSEIMENYTLNGPVIPEGIKNRTNSDWYIAGGSSGGSAIAVATGTCFAAIGSDTGGSTRNPASYCGLIGFKPSYGLVSRYGLIPLVNSMDVPGILSRNVEDCLEILNSIAGPDEKDSTTVDRSFKSINLSSADLRSLRIGIPKEYSHPDLDEEVLNCWKRVSNLLEEAGATVVPVSLPHTEYSIVCYSILNQCEVASNMARYDGLEYGLRPIEMSSTEQLFAEARSMGFNDVVRSRILTGNYFLLTENYDDYFVKAMKLRRLISEDFHRVWEENVDLLLTPTTLSDAPSFKEFTAQDNQTQCSIQDYCTQPANMAGIPAINLPVTVSSRGLPISVQLMTSFMEDERLFAVAKCIEDAVQFPRLQLKNSELLD